MTGERKRGPKGKEAAEEPRLASFEDIMKELDAEFPIEGPAARPAPKARPASEEGAPAAAEGEDLPPLVDAHADVRSGAPTAAARPDPEAGGPATSEAPETPSAAPSAAAEDVPMRRIALEKVVVNIGVGEAGEKLVKAKTLLERLTGQAPVETVSRTTNRDLGIRKGQPIGCKVTMRGRRAEEFLRRALWVKDFRLPSYCFDQEGNVSFGVPDYTEFQDMKYDPEIGIFGVDVSAVFARPGVRIKRRRVGRSHIPHRHRLTSEDGKEFMRRRFSVDVLEVR